MTVTAAATRSRPRLAWGLAGAVAVLAATALLSVAVGSKSIPLGTVFDALIHYDGRLDDHVIVRDLRVPRTLLGLVVGAALGLAGTLIQALTRNPLADPGILGINEGAGLGVIVAVGVMGLSSPWAYVWFAFAGAAISATLVYAVSARSREGASPVRLVLAGIAFTYVLHGVGRAILLTDTNAFDRWRNWMAGSLASTDPDVLAGILPFVAAGVIIGLALTPSLNALALGEEAGQALGVHRDRTRVLGAVAVTLLCGSATAAAGPIAFVGLMVPYLARMITGPDYRWLVPYSLVLAPILLLVSDIAGRLVARPSEIGVGVVTAVIGAPLLIALVRRRGRLPRL
ncbi:FecCD family ABC transporter permease [Phytohabitans rumicis]|uniref:Iron ABC transporter permease n=1 Tax=Phytohabitans rumicis TaxID=1076125 RepID=A0A6V8L9I0_9ACTN|nr:iron chelate uptake ABC transporter family permease subunit [Phytohabitans rumicis]GFJ91461.1 iron ABC transporter permease [Phytohabitans rumicis]